MEDVGLICQLARTGGTLLNKCLGSMKHVIIPSEVHPLYDTRAPLLMQAQEWFDLLNEKETVAIRTQNEDLTALFTATIKAMVKNAKKRNDHIIIRDWTHADYIGVPSKPDPSYTLRTYTSLRESFNVKVLFLLRDPIDQYLSCLSRHGMASSLSVDSFSKGYRELTDTIANIRKGKESTVKIVKYEDFISQPSQSLQDICQYFSVPFDPEWQNNWHSYQYSCGDKQIRENKGSSRGSTLQEIKQFPVRDHQDSLLEEFSANSDYNALLETTGYKSRI